MASESTEKAANSVVLHIVLLLTVGLLLSGIIIAGNLISSVTNMSLLEGAWSGATEGGTIAHTFGILVCITIAILHEANKAVGKKNQVIEKVASILLKLPVIVILLLVALFIAFMGYGKFSTGADESLMGGSYVLDWVTSVVILYLTFFVKKV
jgi:hypothetical protein